MEHDAFGGDRSRDCGFVGVNSGVSTQEIGPGSQAPGFGESFYVTTFDVPRGEVVAMRHDIVLAEQRDTQGREGRTREVFEKTCGGVVVGRLVRRRGHAHEENVA